ncbi:MAG TPA: hypothetical protein IAC31_05160 [Candidatus Faecousia intestinigallinarum]|nr:hypothetical protein [Candidatus Faecousia intestinigallinarum]
MRVKYIYRYITEGEVIFDEVENIASGQKMLGIELACGTAPCTHREIVIVDSQVLEGK